MTKADDTGKNEALKRLDKVYTARSLDDLSEGYAEWAAEYDRDVMTWGYQVPAMVSAMAARHLPAGSGPLLDVGAGTGIVGELLAALGFSQIDALDMSEDMLALARGRGCYAEVRQGVLGQRLDYPDGHFGGAVAAGVFTPAMRRPSPSRRSFASSSRAAS